MVSKRRIKFITKILSSFQEDPLIIWDRFFYDRWNKVMSFYGWIPIEGKPYFDYVQIDFRFKLFSTKADVVGTSSAKYSSIICKKIYGRWISHFDCIKVRDYFQIPNMVNKKNSGYTDA